MGARRILGLLLAAMILGMGMLPAMAEKGPSFLMAGLESDPYRDWQTSLFFARMEEATGVHFNFQQYADPARWTDAKAKMKAGEALPDVLFKAHLTGAECISLLERGVLIDLKPYLEANCPSLWAIFQAHPEYLNAITLPDGRIAALPYIDSQPAQNDLWINERWLRELGLRMPENYQELTDVLTAFRDRDPNRNGRRDEIPLGFLGPFDLKFLGHAFGLIANDYNVFAEEGRVRFMPLEENFRLLIAWCHDLFDAGLLDPNGFLYSSAARQQGVNQSTAVYGMIFSPDASSEFQTEWAEDYGVLPALSFNGGQVYRDFSGPLTRGCFAVTSACGAPETVLQWVDRLYSQEGAALSSVGLETVDYLVDGDGTWHLTEYAKTDTVAFVAASLMNDGYAPGIDAAAFEARYGEDPRVTEILLQKAAVNAVARMPFPYYTLTEAEAAEISALQMEIGPFVDLQIARWVLGEEEISDASFQAFEQALQDRGLPAFLAFWQNIMDRQN